MMRYEVPNILRSHRTNVSQMCSAKRHSGNKKGLTSDIIVMVQTDTGIPPREQATVLLCGSLQDSSVSLKNHLKKKINKRERDSVNPRCGNPTFFPAPAYR